MNKLKFTFLLFSISIVMLNSQREILSVEDCIEMALENATSRQIAKNSILTSRSETMIAREGLKLQASLSYDFKYNAIIPTSLVPSELTGGQGGMGEFTALQFGTQWQQDAGLRLLQPLVDNRSYSEIAEREINEQISILQLKSVEENIALEVVRLYLEVAYKHYQVEMSAVDTLRSFELFRLMTTQYKEGVLLRSTMNEAEIVLNDAKHNFVRALEEKNRALMNLGSLTGSKIPIAIDMNIRFGMEKALRQLETGLLQSAASIESVIRVEEDLLLQQQQNSNELTKSPTILLEGFAGASNFSNRLQPFSGKSWFGNSFIGISIDWPILSRKGSEFKRDIIMAKRDNLAQRDLQEQEDTKRSLDLLDMEISTLEQKRSLLRDNFNLLEENLIFYQDRFDNGKISIIKLNEQKIILDQSAAELKEIEIKLWTLVFEIYVLRGRMDLFLEIISNRD